MAKVGKELLQEIFCPRCNNTFVRGFYTEKQVREEGKCPVCYSDGSLSPLTIKGEIDRSPKPWYVITTTQSYDSYRSEQNLIIMDNVYFKDNIVFETTNIISAANYLAEQMDIYPQLQVVAKLRVESDGQEKYFLDEKKLHLFLNHNPLYEQSSWNWDTLHEYYEDNWVKNSPVKCKDCESLFFISFQEGDWFKSKGFNQPTRCKPCCQKRKTSQGQ